MAFTGSNSQSGGGGSSSGGGQGGFLDLSSVVPVLGQVQMGVNVVEGLIGMFGGGSGPSTWSSPAHHEWVTKYVTNEGLAWADMNAPQHRGNFPMSVDAQGVFYALKGWSPKPGDPYAARYEQIRQAMEQGATAGEASQLLNGTNASSQGTGNNPLNPKGLKDWHWIWPWEKDAFKVAGAWTIAAWAGIFIGLPVLILWLIFRKPRRKRRSRRSAKKRARRMSRNRRNYGR